MDTGSACSEPRLPPITSCRHPPFCLVYVSRRIVPQKTRFVGQNPDDFSQYLGAIAEPEERRREGPSGPQVPSLRLSPGPLSPPLIPFPHHFRPDVTGASNTSAPSHARVCHALHRGRPEWGKGDEEGRGGARGGAARGRTLGGGWARPVASPPRMRLSYEEGSEEHAAEL